MLASASRRGSTSSTRQRRIAAAPAEANVTMASSPWAWPVEVRGEAGASIGNQLMARRQAENTATSATTAVAPLPSPNEPIATAIPAPATPIAIVITRYQAR